MMMDKKLMVNHGRDVVWLRGSRRTIWRSVYEGADGRYWIVWYGDMIEVRHDTVGYTSVESY